MSPENITTVRELDSRVTAGVQVRLLWCEHDGRLWVAALDTKTGEALRVLVAEGERPLDVFHHPYAYAALHGSATYPDSQATVPLGI